MLVVVAQTWLAVTLAALLLLVLVLVSQRVLKLVRTGVPRVRRLAAGRAATIEDPHAA